MITNFGKMFSLHNFPLKLHEKASNSDVRKSFLFENIADVPVPRFRSASLI